MIKLFQTARIKLDEMLSDVSDFIKEVYKQSGQLFTPASPWGQIMMVTTRLSQLIFYYIEDSITELNILTASRPNNIYGLSVLSGHNPTRPISAMGDLYLVYNGVIPNMSGENVIIPNFIKLKCKDNGLTYLGVFHDDEMRINIFNDKSKKFIKIIQGEIETQTFTGTGKDLQSYEVNMSSQKNIDNYFVNVYVNGEKWKQRVSLYDMVNNEKSFILRTGQISGVDIFFGNGYFGMQPPLGSRITVEYLITEGANGNITELSDVIFEFEDMGYDQAGMEINLNEIFNIGIATPISFGANSEPIKLTRALAPHMSRSFVLANTTNYINFFEKFQYFSYIDAYTKFDPKDPFIDNIIYLVLIPDISKKLRSGENYFTTPITFFSLTDLEKFKIQRLLEESGQKIITAIIKFVDPIFKNYVLNINLTTFEGYNKDDIRNNIIELISDYLIKFRRKDFLPKSDLISIIENIKGVDSVSILFISKNIEELITNLITEDGLENTSILTINEKNILKNYYLTETDTNKRIKLLFEQISFKTEALKHIDENGDIALTKDEIPLVRGGFSDRYGKMYFDIINKNKLSSINIIFGKTNKNT